jgi:hypothetical protein
MISLQRLRRSGRDCRNSVSEVKKDQYKDEVRFRKESGPHPLSLEDRVTSTDPEIANAALRLAHPSVAV